VAKVCTLPIFGHDPKIGLNFWHANIVLLTLVHRKAKPQGNFWPNFGLRPNNG
jgi:hypothetical protein